MAVAFKPGQKFKFHDNPITYLFISIHYDNGVPVVTYEGENGETKHAFGYELTDLRHV